MQDSDLEYWLAKLEKSQAETQRRMGEVATAVTYLTWVLLLFVVLYGTIHYQQIKTAFGR